MEFKVLAVGDVVGNPGLDRVRRHLRQLKRKTGADFVVVNGENAAVVGITPNQAEDILDAGADVNALNNRGANYAQITVYKDPTPETLKLLEDIISAGVDLTHKDDKGESFIFYAIPSLCKVNIM